MYVYYRIKPIEAKIQSNRELVHLFGCTDAVPIMCFLKIVVRQFAINVEVHLAALTYRPHAFCAYCGINIGC